MDLDVDMEALNFREERARDVAARYSQTACVEFLDWAGKEACRLWGADLPPVHFPVLCDASIKGQKHYAFF